MAVVWQLLVSFVVLSTGLPIAAHYFEHRTVTATHAALSFFSMLNALICLWEMALFRHVVLDQRIVKEYKALQAKYGDDRFQAAIDFFVAPVSMREVLTSQYWTKVWSTYSLYDPSYSNRESFGFWVDSGNGVTTIIPSLLWVIGMTYPILSPQTMGIMGIMVFYQEFYGTCVYFSTFFCNGRHIGKSTLEVFLFVGLSNGLWFFFPLLGMYTSKKLICDEDFSIFL